MGQESSSISPTRHILLPFHFSTRLLAGSSWNGTGVLPVYRQDREFQEAKPNYSNFQLGPGITRHRLNHAISLSHCRYLSTPRFTPTAPPIALSSITAAATAATQRVTWKCKAPCSAYAAVNTHAYVQRYPADCRAQFFFDVLECILFICYAFELTLRVLAFGLRGFSKGWILFDSALVFIGCVFYVVSYSTNIALDPGAASSLRIIRIARVRCACMPLSWRSTHVASRCLGFSVSAPRFAPFSTPFFQFYPVGNSRTTLQQPRSQSVFMTVP